MLTRSWPIVDKISKIVGAVLTKYQLLLAPYLAIFDKSDNMFDKVDTFDCQMFPKQSGNNLATICYNITFSFFFAKCHYPHTSSAAQKRLGVRRAVFHKLGRT